MEGFNTSYLDDAPDLPNWSKANNGRVKVLRDLLESGHGAMSVSYGSHEEAAAERRRFNVVATQTADLRGRLSMMTDGSTVYIRVRDAE